MARWLVSRRGGILPTRPEEAEGWVLVTRWKKAQWPATQVRQDDDVYVFDSRPGVRRTLFHGVVDRLVTAGYEDGTGVSALLEEEFSASKLPEPLPDGPEPGWVIAFAVANVEWIDEGPIEVHLPALRGGRMGWVELDSVPEELAARLRVKGP